MKQLWHNNSLSIVVFVIFFLIVIGQTLTGFVVYNQDLGDHGRSALSLGQYLVSGHYGEAIFENWESEFLQMSAYIFLTIYLYQRGSAESKDPDKKAEVDKVSISSLLKRGVPGPVRRGGWVLKLYENSLGLAFAVLFLATFVMHGVESQKLACVESQEHNQQCDSLGRYMMGPQFWFESLQNWQSEFLAVGSIVVLSIYLRQKGSPESKPVAAPHSQTGA